MDNDEVRRGARDAVPLLLGVFPFGLIVGVASVQVGLDVLEAAGMSVFVFAGAAQLAAIELLSDSAPLAVVVLTAVVVNLRMAMYSASIAPYFRRFASGWRFGLPYFLTDMAYVVTIVRYRSAQSVDRKAYYVGVAVTIWAVWQVATVVGALLGTGIPDAWSLEFAVPLAFLALVAQTVENRGTAGAALGGGVVAFAGAGLPLNLGLLVGATVGVLAGLVSGRGTPADEPTAVEGENGS
jgi:4-azaleucine resistance transporter AzlC